MRIKRKNGLKVVIIAIALLLCLALAVGITGAWYQAKRQATGTLSMDQGIIIDYKGFNGSETGATWERGTTFELFSTKAGEVQPGAHIKVNAASIKANAKSVNFYARVRLEYKFYNGEAEVTLEDPTVLIKTSNLFGSNWEFSSMAAPKDYYYYVENGTTTFKTMVAGADFVELIQSNAEFIIEGEGFKGSNDLEGGGFVVDETTSINKIVVNLVLETLQGEADPATEGWKIATPVRFAEATGSTTGDLIAPIEDLRVAVGGNAEGELNEVVFPYEKETELTFNNNNVSSVTLTYDKGEPDTFEESSAKTVTVKADSSKGKVTGYVIGFWSTDEYNGFSFSARSRQVEDGTIESEYDVEGGVALYQSYGENTEITIKNSYYLRKRDFKEVWTGGYEAVCMFRDIVVIQYIDYPYTIESYATEINSSDDFMNWFRSLEETDFATGGKYADGVVVKSTKLVEGNILTGTKYSVKEIAPMAFAKDSKLKKVTIEEGVKRICFGAFCADWIEELGGGITEITLPNSLEIIDDYVFNHALIKNITIPANVTRLRSAFDGCKFETVTIDSATVAADDHLMRVFESATIYVKSGLAVGTYVTNSFEKAASSDKAGYDMYTKKA